MKLLRLLFWGILICLPVFVVSCGGGGGGSGTTTSDSGTVTMSITDAKPLLPETIVNFFVEFSEVWVHKPGNGWIQLLLFKSPYTIDLLQFQNGSTTEFVPPVLLSSGKYTQVRFVLNSAELGVANGNVIETVPVEIPSNFLRIDKNFTIDLNPDGAIDLLVHFDLGMSLVVTGTEEAPEYKLKPVLHLFDDPLTAAIIEGSIIFGEANMATIVVIAESNGEEYTKVEVEKGETDSADYSIFWIVPNQNYTVQIDIDQDDTIDCEITIGGDESDFDSPEPGEVVDIMSCSQPPPT